MTGRYGVPNVDGVYTADTQSAFPRAECMDCPWQRQGGTGVSWLAIRAAARRHAGRTGHSAQAIVTYVYTYAAQAVPERVR